MVVGGHRSFSFGPMRLARRGSAQRSLAMELASVELVVGHVCDVLRVRLAPGFGVSAAEQLAHFVDRKERLMRRVRFTLDGVASTRGAVAEVETFDHDTLHGVRWPTRVHERLLRPLPLPPCTTGA